MKRKMILPEIVLMQTPPFSAPWPFLAPCNHPFLLSDVLVNLPFLLPYVSIFPLTSVTDLVGPCTLTNVLWQVEKATLHSVDLHCFDSPSGSSLAQFLMVTHKLLRRFTHSFITRFSSSAGAWRRLSPLLQLWSPSLDTALYVRHHSPTAPTAGRVFAPTPSSWSASSSQDISPPHRILERHKSPDTNVCYLQ